MAKEKRKWMGMRMRMGRWKWKWKRSGQIQKTQSDSSVSAAVKVAFEPGYKLLLLQLANLMNNCGCRPPLTPPCPQDELCVSSDTPVAPVPLVPLAAPKNFVHCKCTKIKTKIKLDLECQTGDIFFRALPA